MSFLSSKTLNGNIKSFGKYQPEKINKAAIPVRPPSRLKYNPIVKDTAFTKV